MVWNQHSGDRFYGFALRTDQGFACEKFPLLEFITVGEGRVE